MNRHRQVETLAPAQQLALAALRERIASYRQVLVAYSGGVDSALVAAFRQLGFSAVSLDLEGLVSGKLNRDHLEAASRREA